MGKNEFEFHIRNPAEKLHCKRIKKNEMQKNEKCFRLDECPIQIENGKINEKFNRKRFSTKISK